MLHLVGSVIHSSISSVHHGKAVFTALANYSDIQQLDTTLEVLIHLDTFQDTLCSTDWDGHYWVSTVKNMLTNSRE